MKLKHLRKAAEFAEILRNCEKIRESRVSVFFRRHCSPGGLFVGIIISKKTEPLATRRNYMRRVIYSVCGEKEDSSRKKTEMIVRVDGKTSGKGRKALYSELRRNLKNALKKIGEQ